MVGDGKPVAAGWNGVVVSERRRARGLNGAGADEYARPVWRFFQYPKLAQTCKFKTDAFHCSKNTQALHDARFDYLEQTFQLGRLQIPNIIRVINFGTYSNLNILWILKGFKSCGKKFRKFSKILSGFGLHNCEFSWAHLYARNLSFYTSVKWLGLNIRKEFEFEIQTIQHL
jgi:hypothetical protein